jgi:hypothetical protein
VNTREDAVFGAGNAREDKLRNEDAIQRSVDQQRADQAKALARNQQLEDEQRIMGYVNSTGSGSGGSGGGTGGGSSTSGIPADESAARAAAFARAKEQAGHTARASLNSLYDVMASTGRAGSGAEASLTGDIVSGAAGDINDFTRDQSITDTNRAADISDRNYAGDLTRRGQDMAKQQTLLGLLSARGGLY